jgi:hypothetical protein
LPLESQTGLRSASLAAFRNRFVGEFERFMSIGGERPQAAHKI